MKQKCSYRDWELQTLDDLHKPQLDGIGFQDLNESLMAWWKAATDTQTETSVGKQPAWINYMTNVNKTYGNFAIEGNEAFMCLNRFYDCLKPSEGNWNTEEIDYTTYINPSKFNYTLCYRDWETDRKSTRLNSSHSAKSRMPSSA